MYWTHSTNPQIFDQQPICTNVACGNQTLKINIASRSALIGGKTEKKVNILKLYWEEIEIEKVMRFLKDIEIFEKISI